MSSGAGHQTKGGEPVHLFRLDTDECRYLCGPSAVTVPAVDQYWTPCSSSPWMCQLSSTCCDQVLGYILAEEKKGSLGWLVQLVCALKPMIFTFYDIILLTEPCFQNYGGIAKPMNC